MSKRVLLYVGPARLLEEWLAEQLRLCAGFGEKNVANTDQLEKLQKKSHCKSGRNWK